MGERNQQTFENMENKRT